MYSITTVLNLRDLNKCLVDFANNDIFASSFPIFMTLLTLDKPKWLVFSEQC